MGGERERRDTACSVAEGKKTEEKQTVNMRKEKRQQRREEEKGRGGSEITRNRLAKKRVQTKKATIRNGAERRSARRSRCG